MVGISLMSFKLSEGDDWHARADIISSGELLSSAPSFCR